MNISSITPDTLEQLLNGETPPFILDVREPKERDTFGSIASSVAIESGNLMNRLTELPENKEAPLIVVCQTGSRSLTAARLLSERGYHTVVNLHGGMLQWILQRKAVRRPHSAP